MTFFDLMAIIAEKVYNNKTLVENFKCLDGKKVNENRKSIFTALGFLDGRNYQHVIRYNHLESFDKDKILNSVKKWSANQNNEILINEIVQHKNLAEDIGVSPSYLTDIINKMYKYNFIEKSKRGKYTFYSLTNKGYLYYENNPGNVNHLMKELTDIIRSNASVKEFQQNIDPRLTSELTNLLYKTNLNPEYLFVSTKFEVKLYGINFMDISNHGEEVINLSKRSLYYNLNDNLNEDLNEKNFWRDLSNVK